MNCVRSNILQEISKEICEARFFSISADETCETFRKEQLILIIRYVDKDLRAVESCIGFFELDKQTGAAISDQILEHLREPEIDLNHMVG